MSVLRRLVLVPLGILLAGFTALGVGLVGALARGYGSDVAGFAADTGFALVAAAVTGQSTGADPDALGSLLGALWLVVVGIPFVPVALVALVGEGLGIGSWMAYVLGTGALFAAVPALFPGVPPGHEAVIADGVAALPGWPPGASSGLAATGFAAGFVYWLVAGQGAPRRRAPRFDGPDSRLGGWSAPSSAHGPASGPGGPPPGAGA